jgi:hypothetical protein
MKIVFILLLSFSLQVAYSQKIEPCDEVIPCNEKNPEIFIFIGKKINVSPVEQPRSCYTIGTDPETKTKIKLLNRRMDSKSKSKYKILKKISKNINFEIIDFVSYDHASIVRYDEFENVLLFVGKYCNELIHQKYQYQPVYKMKNGKWASPVCWEFDTSKRKSNKHPHKVDVPEPITIPKYQTYQKLKNVYPEPYYEIKEGKVYMRYGYYPEDLITK